MLIKELVITSFGKFFHKTIEFKSGINLVQGNNETGKSTIHAFIESMLYGFKNNSGAIDNKLKKKYKPWNNEQFSGTMLVENTDEYIVKRDFDKDELYFAKQLESREEEINSVKFNEEEVGSYLFGLNKSTFANTLSIKQLGNLANEDLAKDVKLKISNLSQTKSENISLEKILKKISFMKEDNTDVDNPKSMINQYKMRIKELQEKREEILKERKKTITLAQERRQFEQKIEEHKTSIKAIKRDLEKHRLFKLYIKKKKADDEFEKLERIKEELQQCGKASSLSIEEYEETIKLFVILEQAKEKKESIEKEILEVKKDLEELENDTENNVSNDGVAVKINLDYNEYTEINNKITKLEEKVYQGKAGIYDLDLEEIDKFVEYNEVLTKNEDKIATLELLIKDDSKEKIDFLIKGLKSRKKLLLAIGGILLFVAAFSVYMGFRYNQAEYYFGLTAAILTVYIFTFAERREKKITALVEQSQNIDVFRSDTREELMSLRKEKGRILDESNCVSLNRLREKCKQYVMLRSTVEARQRLIDYDKELLRNSKKSKAILENEILNKLEMFDIDEINDEAIQKLNDIVSERDKIAQNFAKKTIILEKLYEDYIALNEETRLNNTKMDTLLASHGIENTEQLKELIDNEYKIKQLTDELKNKEIIIENMLGEHTYSELEEKLNNLFSPEEDVEAFKDFDVDDNLKQIIEKEEGISSARKKISKLTNEIDSIEAKMGNLSESTEGIDFYTNKINECIEKEEAIDLAYENISLISNYIKGNFMPLLRNAISENFAYVTENKYKEVLIDENMNISILAKDDKVVKIEALSSGTIDQLYISLRLGLSNLISEDKNVPLILDDSFIQYDEERLTKSLELLNREKNKRQVILFTCQKREKVILDRLGIPYNNIDIS